MVSKKEQRRSARVSAAKETITRKAITTSDAVEKPISANTTNYLATKLNVVKSEDDPEVRSKKVCKQTTEDAEFTRWMATSETDDSENIPNESIVQNVLDILGNEEKHFQRIQV